MTLLEYYRINIGKEVEKINLLYLSPNYDPKEDNLCCTDEHYSLWVNEFYDEIIFRDGTKKYYVDVNEYGTHLEEVNLYPHLDFCTFEKDITDDEIHLDDIRGDLLNEDNAK